MSVSTPAAAPADSPPGGSARPPARPPGFLRRNAFQLAVLVPTLTLLAIFVYGFITYTFRVSLSRWQGIAPNLRVADPPWRAYTDMLGTVRFQADMRNIVVFTVLFLVMAVLLGLLLAVLVHNALGGRAFFRTIFLFPYALSFIVTGVVWRWIFTPSAGANLILESLGVENPPGWITDPTVAGDVSGALNAILPGADFIQIQLGIPLALIPIAIAAAWQLSGFAMAVFLAALGTIPEELREAAELDGASVWQYHWHVVLPWLRPMIVVVLVILGHTSLRVFDLVVAMSGQGPGFATDVPGIFVFDQTFRALRYNTGAAASIVMLVLVAAVVLPYLYRSYVKESR
ncbi:carbohydrate ABC transporter permease [Pseudonocardia alni]|uniref:carbohydrate ABC transporter permease n=1 Tax=Pseudonocardia alni TaxID=33907 RepID=UPI003409649A